MANQDKEKKYTCPYCAQVFNSIEELKQDILTNHKGKGLPAPEGQIRMMINNQAYTCQVEPDWTLYYVLHDRLGFTGAKQFCDRGACGSCTVIMNGRPVLSCMMLAVECDGANIETIEGIALSGHPLIESYVNNHAMQCGYCTPGFIASSKALLDKKPDPSEQEIMEALAGNLCRCSTYPQHPIAVKEAAKKMQSENK